MHDVWLGIDIGGTSTRMMLMEGVGNWSGFKKVTTASWANQGDILTNLAQLIAPLLAERQISGLMLGLPGILSHNRQSVISLPFLPALDNQPVIAWLETKLQIPVAMDKDVNHLLLWDLCQLPTLPQHAVGIYPGTGIGNSLWINGSFYHGAHGGSGELGHIPFPYNDLPCPCGNTGCVETLTSGHWLIHWARQEFPDTPLSDLFTVHSENPQLQAFVNRIGQLIASEMNILDPEYLIIGGGITAMNHFPVTTLLATIQRHLRPPVTQNQLKIIISHATDTTGCRGACLAAERYFRR